MKIIFLFYFFSASAFSLTLTQARKEKIVTELKTGYLKANGPKGKKLALEINAKRKKAYQAIQKSTGLSLVEVAKRSALKIQEKLKASKK